MPPDPSGARASMRRPSLSSSRRPVQISAWLRPRVTFFLCPDRSGYLLSVLTSRCGFSSRPILARLLFALCVCIRVLAQFGFRYEGCCNLRGEFVRGSAVAIPLSSPATQSSRMGDVEFPETTLNVILNPLLISQLLRFVIVASVVTKPIGKLSWVGALSFCDYGAGHIRPRFATASASAPPAFC